MGLRCSCCRLWLRQKFRVSIRTGMDMGSVAGSVAGSGAGSGAGLGGMGIGRGSGTGLGPGACGTGTGAGPVSGTRKSLGMGRDRSSTCLRRGPPHFHRRDKDSPAGCLRRERCVVDGGCQPFTKAALFCGRIASAHLLHLSIPMKPLRVGSYWCFSTLLETFC